MLFPNKTLEYPEGGREFEIPMSAVERKSCYHLREPPNSFYRSDFKSYRHLSINKCYVGDRGPMQLHTLTESGLQNFNAWQARAPNFHRKKKM